MVDVNNLNNNERIFLREFIAYNKSREIMNSDEPDKLKSALSDLSDEYLHLLKQAVKLVKVSDSNQLKLRNAQSVLKEQSEKIEAQNSELLKSNQEKEETLKKLNNELSKAASYVKSLLPKPLKNHKSGLNICWKFEPSSKLGGDLFGYKFFDEKHVIFYLFDVSGHGIGPALYSVSVCNAINDGNILQVDFLSPASVFRGLNKVFDMRKHNDLYFTIWYGVYNLESKKLRYASAGHPPAILLSKHNNKKLPPADNFFIGGLPNYNFEEMSIKLDKGDVIYLFSDGAYEIRTNDTEYFTLQELETLINTYDGNDNILDIIYNHLKLISYELPDSSLEDDFSMMRIQF